MKHSSLSTHETSEILSTHSSFNVKNIFSGIRKAEKILSLLIVVSIFSGGCKKKTNEIPNPLDRYTGLSSQVRLELEQARGASTRYQHIDSALADGYADIAVNTENMGHHYMKATLVDSIVDFKEPEILVYNKDENGNLYLVAIEYAVPLNKPKPEGFTGSADVWDGNTGFQLWLLHAWLWSYNPDGVFHPTNSLIHLH